MPALLPSAIGKQPKHQAQAHMKTMALICRLLHVFIQGRGRIKYKEKT